jgi:hypothetical protein
VKSATVFLHLFLIKDSLLLFENIIVTKPFKKKMKESNSHHYSFNRKKETITTIIICLVLLFSGITVFYNYNYDGNQFPTAEARCPNNRTANGRPSNRWVQGPHKEKSRQCIKEILQHHDGRCFKLLHDTYEIVVD